MLLAILIFLLVLCSGSALFCAATDLHFEELAPLTGIGVILVLFLFGLAGSLAMGVYAVLALALACWALAALEIWKKGFRSFAHRFFSPGFWLFLLLAATLLVLNLGREFVNWDDFSHWGDVVKLMVTQGVFNTDPQAGSMYPEYPPGVALFQYFLQRLLLLAGGRFNEGLVYFCHQFLLYLLPFPFLKQLNFRKPESYILLALLFLCPLPFFPELFPQLKVDAILGALFACILAWSFTGGLKTPAGMAYALLSTALLPLVKTSGILLALLAAAGIFLAEDKPGGWAGLVRRLSGLAAALLPWLLWEGNVWLSQARRAFTINLNSASGGFLGPDAYRLESFKQFVEAFLSRNVTAEETVAGGLPPVFLLVLGVSLLYFLLSLGRRKDRERAAGYARLFWLTLVSAALFYIGLCGAYLFSFSQEEAISLAAFERYTGTIHLSVYQLLLLLTLRFIAQGFLDGRKTAVLFFCGWTAVTPWLSLMRYAGRSNVVFSQEYRRESDGLVERLTAAAGTGEYRVYVLSSEPSDYLTMHYQLRPGTVNGSDSWWNTPIVQPQAGETLAEAWRRELLEGYDYVLIFDLAENMKDEFGSVFADPDSLQDYSAYRVDKTTGLLERCG